MNTTSPILLFGAGTAGCAMTRGVRRAFGNDLRFMMVDTDASSGNPDDPFFLLGGERLSGRGAGGDVVTARLATEESIKAIDDSLGGVRLAVILTALGGGSGAGITIEAVKHFAAIGIRTIVFATTPFAFEGEERTNSARGVMPMIQEHSNAAFFIPLDKLVQAEDNMDAALSRAIDTLASGISLFWRLIEKPGYIRLDTERICQLIGNAGAGRFAAVTVQGTNRAADAIDSLIHSELLAASSFQVNSIVCGILAGEDLRLSEISVIADGIQNAFGSRVAFNLGTVNDEMTFCGRLSVIVLLFEGAKTDEATISQPAKRTGKRYKPTPLAVGPSGRGRFNNSERTEWHGEDLDIPTFIRLGISLDF